MSIFEANARKANQIDPLPALRHLKMIIAFCNGCLPAVLYRLIVDIHIKLPRRRRFQDCQIGSEDRFHLINGDSLLLLCQKEGGDGCPPFQQQNDTLSIINYIYS